MYRKAVSEPWPGSGQLPDAPWQLLPGIAGVPGIDGSLKVNWMRGHALGLAALQFEAFMMFDRAALVMTPET
jgi:hypothetical protein